MRQLADMIIYHARMWPSSCAGRTLKTVLASMSQWGQAYVARLKCGKDIKSGTGVNAELLELCGSTERAA